MSEYGALLQRIDDLERERDESWRGQIGALRQEFEDLNKDFFLEVAAGRVAGTSCVNKFGENPTVASGATEDIWDGSVAYVFPTTATITHIRAATNTASMRGLLIEMQGLDANWDLVVQNATLNGADSTTEVALTDVGVNLIRVFRLKVIANVVGDSAVWIGATGVAAATANAIIQAGNNQTLMAIYTIPNGKTGYLTQYYRGFVKVTGATPDSVEFNLWAADRDNSYEFQLKHSSAVQNDAGAPVHPFQPYVKFTQKTDLKMTATSNGSGSHVHAGFDIILVDN